MKSRAYLGAITLLAAALPTEPRTIEDPNKSVSAQHFACDTGYSQDECDRQMIVLRKAIAKYTSSQLGEWTWVLVRSARWELILRAKGINPVVPALTDPAGRATFFEEALVAGCPGRIVELMGAWHMGRERLLDLAVRHELGHALCHEPREKEANRVAELLEQKGPISCKPQIEAGRTNKTKSIDSFEHPSDPDHESLNLEFQ
jgi:hypothetical protein